MLLKMPQTRKSTPYGTGTEQPGNSNVGMPTMSEGESSIMAAIGKLSSKTDESYRKLNVAIEDSKQYILDQLKSVRDDLTLEINMLKARVESMELEKSGSGAFNDEFSVIIFGLRESSTETQESLHAEIDVIIEKIGCAGSVTKVKRLRSRLPGKPGIVKVQMSSLDEKIAVLRNKRKLSDQHPYAHTYIKASKTHCERLIELNFKEILKELPRGTEFRFTGSGRLVKKTNVDEGHRQLPGHFHARSPVDNETTAKQLYSDALSSPASD